MKRVILILCLIMMFCFVAGVEAAQTTVSFTSDAVEISVGRRLYIDSMLNVEPEEYLTEISCIVSDEAVGEIIDGEFVSKKSGSVIVSAYGFFEIDGEAVIAYDTLSVIVNPDGIAVKTYDTNMDGIINSADLSSVLSAYGSQDFVCDFNEDGVVNSTDLSLILSRYGSSL